MIWTEKKKKRELLLRCPGDHIGIEPESDTGARQESYTLYCSSGHWFGFLWFWVFGVLVIRVTNVMLR